jgi:hypothetical protein
MMLEERRGLIQDCEGEGEGQIRFYVKTPVPRVGPGDPEGEREKRRKGQNAHPASTPYPERNPARCRRPR